MCNILSTYSYKQRYFAILLNHQKPMNKRTFSLAMLAVYLAPAIVFGQTLTIKESPKEKADYLHKFFKPAPDRYLAINYASPHSAFGYDRNTSNTEITCYDSSLNEVYSTRVQALKGNKYVESIEIDQKHYILFADNKKIFRCELNPSDGQLKGSPAEILSVTKKTEEAYTGVSSNNNLCFAVFTDEKNEVYEGVIMDKQLNVITKFAYEPGKIKGKIRQSWCILSNEGTLYIVNRIDVNSGNNDYRPKQYLVTEISRDGKAVSTPLTDLPSGLIHNMVWKVDKNVLSFVGLLSRSEKEIYTVILSGEFSSSQKKIINLNQSLINDAAYWQKATGKYLLAYQSGIGTSNEIVSSIIGDDGSVTMVLLTTDIRYISRGSYYASDASTRDAVVVKISPDHELAWLQFVPLGQQESNTFSYSGVIATSPNKKDLLLFFHDNTRNYSSPPDGSYSGVTLLKDVWYKDIDLAVVHIAEDGTVTRKSAGATVDPDFHFAGREPYFIAGNEIIYTSYNIKNAGRSKYRPGLIKISMP
jgi:hypothetical protein